MKKEQQNTQTEGQVSAVIEKPARRRSRRPAKKQASVRIIPLGGLTEIGKTMTVIECMDDMIVIDCGMGFPDEDMPGIDIVIPDTTWLEKNIEKIKGIVLTHGHEDHIGALPYVLKKINVPVYGTRLTIGLVEGKLKEHGLVGKVKLNVVKVGDTIKLGCMSVEFIRVNHSIADACALGITTPAGLLVHSGDFKVDYTPIDGVEMIDLARFGELGRQGVLALMMDSTNAEEPGTSMSERDVGESFDGLFTKAKNSRIIVATFSSHVNRVQQIINAAVSHGRHVAVTGRSMLNVFGIASELGYLSVPDGVMVDIKAISRYPKDKMVIICTGSQGEPMSALYRMAFSDHREVKVGSDDFVIISASAIPGNEKTVSRVVNELLRLGAEVIYESLAKVHVSGHACQDELKLMLGLTKPKFFFPVHGEYKHLLKNVGLAQSMGIDRKNITIPEVGKIFEVTASGVKTVGTVPSGSIMIDGLGVGDVGNVVIKDRKLLAEDGLIIVGATIEGETHTLIAGPDIVSRGFVYVKESGALIDETRKVAEKVLGDCLKGDITDLHPIKIKLSNALSDFLYKRTKRSPMILPIIMKI
ncbi:MAG: ribonuclease J [Oscillospiraceae bacterium]|nr:ribonuclease J [Oscillospiraceae bacterium]